MPRGVPVSFTKDELIGQTCQAQLEGRPLLKETVDNSIKETIELMVGASIFIRFFQILKDIQGIKGIWLSENMDQ